MIGYERIIRPQGVLYSISCLETDFGGRCKPGYWWGYAFYHQSATGQGLYDAWRVYGDGRVSWFDGVLPTSRNAIGDLSPSLQFDSDRAAASVAQLSRECVERYPDRDWNYQMQYQFGGVEAVSSPVIHAIFKARIGQFNPAQAEAYLDARTGAVLKGGFICRPD